MVEWLVFYVLRPGACANRAPIQLFVLNGLSGCRPGRGRFVLRVYERSRVLVVIVAACRLVDWGLNSRRVLQLCQRTRGTAVWPPAWLLSQTGRPPNSANSSQATTLSLRLRFFSTGQPRSFSSSNTALARFTSPRGQLHSINHPACRTGVVTRPASFSTHIIHTL